MTKPPAIRDLMPEMTAKEDDFVEHFVQFGDAIKAAEAAGYAQAGIQGRQIARRPRVAAAIRIATARRMQALAPVALTVLDKVMRDDKAPAGARVDAAKTILDRGGYGVPVAEKARSSEDRPLAEMSIPELERLVRELEEKRAAEARDVTPDSGDNAPMMRADDAQVIDPLE
ncbi:MAG TPA: hypothetical protein VIU82_00260 [Bosea sp. (in: a-proteobacteria)]